MAQNTFSAIGGIGLAVSIHEKISANAAAGFQQNLNYSMGNYSGSSNIPGYTSFSVQMPNYVNSMATASAGIAYDVQNNQRLGLSVLWQQQPFISTDTTNVIATYTIGL